METQVRNPQMVFMQPQRLIVPLFQRPYVWNESNQWAPLWADVVRVAERVVAMPLGRPQPHFLGAVVLQQMLNPVGMLQQRLVIDGQQRLTTLQILLDALHAELVAVDAIQPALRLESLVANPEPFCVHPEDRFKVWPTNRDRPAFNDVMSAEIPVKYTSLPEPTARLVEAHKFFATEARAWLVLNGEEDIERRAAAIELTVRELIQIVVIDLTADENAQEIFETLNARGAQLTAADLIKNFIFQRLMEQKVDVEPVYERLWKEFETAFWETEVAVGRIRYSRSSSFLNHWLIARTGEEITAREVFSRFKRYADFEAGVPMLGLVTQLHRAADLYRKLVEAAAKKGPLDRTELFAYRTSALESEVVKPLLLWLYDDDLAPLAQSDIDRSLNVVESWLVRRMLVRAGTKSYTKIFAELLTELRKGDRTDAGGRIETYLRTQASESGYWPDDADVRRELSTLPIYRRLSRGRLRIVLEAVEDHLRGWAGAKAGLGGERVSRNTFSIEHVMPQSWEANWPMEGTATEQTREALLHVLGNLTLLTAPLNAKVSNESWTQKKKRLAAHDALFLNRVMLDKWAGHWDEATIVDRTAYLSDTICQVWPAPAGHQSPIAGSVERPAVRVGLDDLISEGLLLPGAILYPRSPKHEGRCATLLPSGQIEIDGVAHATPSGAARAITGGQVNGWWFFLVDPARRVSLADIWTQYVNTTNIETEDIGEDAGGDD